MTDQWKGIENSEMTPCILTQLVSDKSSKNIWRKGSLFNEWYRENWISICRRAKLDPSLSPYKNNNSKWVNHLNVRPQTMKLLQCFRTLVWAKICLYVTPKSIGKN
jgi:hypothetical protein